MEDDEDTQSHVSLDSGDNSTRSGNSAGDNSPVAAVTVAAVPTAVPMNNSNVTNTPPPPPLTLALPIQQPSSSSSRNAVTINGGGGGGGVGGGGGGGGGREDCWSEGATSVLIDAWGERYMELSRGNLKQKHWKEVADIVSSREDYRKTPKTDIQCKNRIDTVKKKYKTEKAKVVSGGGPSRWPFFERLDRLIGPSALAAMAKGSLGSGGAVVASVSPSPASQKVVPMGIPVGVRQHQSLPLPYLHTPPSHMQPSPPQLMRQSFNTPTPPPIPQPRVTPNYNQSPNVNHNYNQGLNRVYNLGSASANVSNVGSFSRGQQQPHYSNSQSQQQQFRRGVVVPPPVDSDSEGEGWSNDSGDSFPPETGRKRGREEMSGSRKKGRKAKKTEVKEWGSSVRELTRAILKFGEAYEAAEGAKLQHIVEMEKQRMKFAKDLELQRMKFLMKTQLELSQFNENGNGSGDSDSRGGGGSNGRRGGGNDGGGGGGSNHTSRVHENHANHVDLANSDSSH